MTATDPSRPQGYHLTSLIATCCGSFYERKEFPTLTAAICGYCRLVDFLVAEDVIMCVLDKDGQSLYETGTAVYH